jgi:alanine racemase
LNRKLTNQGQVLIQGKRYPMVGTVTMDQTMVDIGDEPVKTGDEVIVWGESKQGTIEVSEVAEKIGTIPYEVTCGVSRRVPRIYVGDS